jgi:DNA invertase Pin-like site-specific DNA recombinase
MTEGIGAVIYAAKSTEDKHGSIGTQLDDCRRLCAEKGWPVLGEYSDEDFSAYHGNRGPDLAQAKKRLVESAPCWLVVQHTDRLARGAGDAPGAADHLMELFFWLSRREIKLWAVQSGEIDRIRALLEGERNTEDSKRKSAAVTSGLMRRKGRGQPVGPVPFGFKVEKRVIEGEIVISERVVDPAEAPVVTEVYERHAGGEASGELARRLNRQGYRTMRGKPWGADAIRWMIENDSYQGRNGYPRIVSDELAERARAQLRRADPAARQRRRGGRPPKEPAMLRGIGFCACGAPLYLMSRSRAYLCRNVHQRNGLCDRRPIPAEAAEMRVLEHLRLFVGDVGAWIGEKLAERSDAQQALQRVVDGEKARLVVLDRQREERMAEITEHGISSPLAFEVIERIDQQREAVERDVRDAQARLDEWTAELDGDAVLAYYRGVVDVVEGRIAKAEGIGEINAALHESLTGIWLSFDGRELTAAIRLRPTGDDDIDQVLAEMFPTLEPEPWAIVDEAWSLADQARKPGGSHTTTWDFLQAATGIPIPPLSVAVDRG